MLQIALIQLCASADIAGNIATVSALVREAAGAGAEFVLTPENTGFMETNTRKLFNLAVAEEDDETLRALTAVAREEGIWLLLGSLAVQVGDGKLANRSFLIAPDGNIVTRYDKAHMFDVSLPGGENYHESKNYQPGSRAVVAESPWGGIGMTVCYDLRFPYLYRKLAEAGARILTVPSAFTRPTGEAHWHILLRARAIETGCFVLAPAQTGIHPSGRRTFGHSLAIDPWGRILADGGTPVGVTYAKLDLKQVDRVRRSIPSLKHTRLLDEI
ncbi:MAG: carbon-nitrogen hydrolase family protein [Proteobacteria bacterium]|nr:carbon-nitrogen hydrolase family protein [Pseudomonadota bacterium]